MEKKGAASMPRIRLRFGLKLFLSHFIAVLLVSGSVGTFFYINAIGSLMQSLRSRLKNSASTGGNTRRSRGTI